MYKLILTTLFSTVLSSALNANNPKPYAVLGDVIYDNAENIKSLKLLNAYKFYSEDIDIYTHKVSVTKKNGYKLEKSATSSQKREYLNKLRSLSKTNDYFLRSIKTKYDESMIKNNFSEFEEIINSGLIDVDAHKDEIINYYYKNKDDINSSGVIDTFLEEDARLRAIKEAQKKHYKTKKQLQEEKIRRIRENDKAVQKKLEDDLQKDLSHKKLEIRKLQKKELAN